MDFKNLKQIKISKDQRVSMLAVSIAAIVVIFTIFYGRRQYSVYTHYNAVLACQKQEKEISETSRKNLDALNESYKEFNAGPKLLGDRQESGVKNSVIVLRALLPRYSYFEALRSFNEFFRDQDYGTATVNLPQTSPEGAADSTAITPIPFTVSVSDITEEDLLNLFDDLDNLIQPINILDIQVEYGEDKSSLTVTMNLETYIQSGTNIQEVTKSVAGSEGCVEKTATPDGTQTETKENET